jgi:hypothetical protein
MEYFDTNGKRSYEDRIYSNLGEFYFEKRRYSDAAPLTTRSSSVTRSTGSRRVSYARLEIHMAGGFPSVVIDSKRICQELRAEG